ncbi:hemagglutinin repeat-containing protein [Paraburkholderia phenazinium]|uniref:Filamentous hemagglutinin n=1 Tax=Paraburkholderia phenazinium TaxID=60549 RepID=A0A1N6JIJ5_9BURK|nr:hemagglutinin repeat-containing protein [Paraburkholderia phenazinium]SIO44100.1 filamentous hemagglutinin [Paraburkholderia phenazinium]
MNKQTYRLVFSRLRGMLVAVEETATGNGKKVNGETSPRRAIRGGRGIVAQFALRHAALGALTFAGTVTAGHAQIVPDGAHAPSVIQTQSGLPQVNINRPSGAGVSLNTYGQFDVQKPGAILNNSPTIVQTQQAGYVNGNPNFQPGQSASIIVNQVNSNNPSQLRGYVEVAGRRAEVVIANSSGLIVGGGGFINTSRAILTTGTPTFGANGNLTGFDVTGGQITVQGAGLNASNVDQVDLIARAVQANAAIYGNTLNIVAGANHVDHDTLAATPIAGNGPPPAVSIDVSQLGGMYANRIFLASNEYGVGVSNAGVIAAQAGDLTLTTQGRLVLSGHASASGNVALSAAGGVANSGTTYAQQGVSVNTAADLTNSGTLAAQQNTSVNAGSVNSTGTLAAGINNDGSIATAGDLTVVATGSLAATGQNAAGGNATLQGASANLAGSQTSATGNLTLVANAGDLDLAGATASAGGRIDATAQGTLIDAGGTISAGLQTEVTAATLNNNAGTISANQLTVSVTNLTNSGGRISQTGTGTTAINVSGTLDNSNGSLQTNSAGLTLTPGTLINDHGTMTDSGTGTLSISTGTLSNNGGTLATNGALDVNAGAVSNEGGKLTGQSEVIFSVASLDNSAGGYIGAQNVAVTDAGGLNNAGGTLEANGTLSASAQTFANDGGSISNAGTQSTDVTASGALTNTQGGVIAGNGAVSVSGGSVNNSGGSVLAGGATIVQSGSTLTNAAGLIKGNGAVAAIATGTITNTGGEIESNGSTTTLSVSGGSLDNTNGRIADTGTGATTINAGSITNANPGGVTGAGTIGGNGDVTLTGQTLSNGQGAQIVAAHDLTLNVAQAVNNNGGTLSGLNDLTLNGSGATLTNQSGSIHGDGAITLDVASLDNTAGKIGNDTGSGGSIAINAGTLSNQGGAIGSDQNLNVTTSRLSGDGRIIAGNNGELAVNGSYTDDAANTIQANNNLTFSTTGNFTNQGTLSAVNGLTVNAASVDNQAGAVLNSASTTVNTSGALTNEGTLAGATVTTQSSLLTNTGTVVGNNVTLSAGSIDNTGSAAAIAAATQLNLYAANELSNTGGANIQSLGNLAIAANANRDGNGVLANRTGVVTNDQSTIQAQGNMEIAAGTLSNTRPAPTIEKTETSDDTVHQTKRDKYVACATTNADSHSSCSQAVWDFGYKSPINSTYSTSQVVSQTSGPNATNDVLVVNVGGQQQTIYYNSITNNGDGTITVNYWDDYNPSINYLPSTEYPTRNDAHHGYQRVEIARDTETITEQDKVTGSPAQEAQLLAGGNMTLANVGTINNGYSAIAAGNSIQIGSTQQGGSIGSGSYGGTTVSNTGQTLYQYQTQNIVSTYAWNEDITRDVGTVAEAPVVLAPVAIGGTGGTIIANNSVQINATNLNNTNVAAANSATGATGGTLGTNAALAGVSPGSSQVINAATGQQAAVNAPQSVAGHNGSLNIRLPTSGLYALQTAPGQEYLVATNPMLTSYTSFISSNYMLQALGFNPQTTEKRLGDGLYEEGQVQNQITQLTGRVYLQGYNDNEDEYKALMTAGVNAAQQFNLEPGVALTAAQMDSLTSDMVWLVNQTVTLPDGSTQQVLAPVVYLAQTHANDLQPTGALIAADDVEIHATGSVVNSGVIKGGTQTVVAATDILNRAGTIGSSSTNGTTVVSATHDVVNASGQITGNRVAVLAGNDIVNTTLVDTVGVSAVSGDSKVNTGLVGQQGSIASTGDLMVSAGHDLSVDGANIAAGGNAQITAGHDITVDTVQSTTDQSVDKNANHHWEATGTTNETSAISAVGSLAMQSGNDSTFKGAQVTAGTGLSVIAGGNLTAATVTNTSQYDNVATDDKTRQEVDHTYGQQVVGFNLSAGGNATLAAVNAVAGGNSRADGAGNVTLTGSTVTAGIDRSQVANGAGALTIAGNGNVTINEGREEHDSATAVQSKRGSFVSGSTTDTSQNTQSNVGVASTLSGDSVNVHAGKDLTVQGSNVVGTNDVNLAALGNVDITTSQDRTSSASSYDKHESGLLSNGGLSVTIGSRSLSQTDQSSAVTNNASVVGSSSGNVTISAGKDATLTGSEIVAGQDVGITAQNVTVNAAYDTYQDKQTQQEKQAGLSVGLGGGVLQTAQMMASDVNSGVQSGDSRLAAVQGLAAAEAAYQNKGQIANAASALANGSGIASASGVQLQISVGSSQSNSSSSTSATTARGSSIIGNGNVSITATGVPDANGNTQAGTGDIAMTGATVMGKNVALSANNDITLQSAHSTEQDTSSNSSSGFSAGVGIGVSSKGGAGISVSASVSEAGGHGNGSSVTQDNTTLSAGNMLSMHSGRDATLDGAQASGTTVNVDVGRNLTMTSEQDTSTYANSQHSVSGGLSYTFGAGGFSGDLSVSKTNINSNYASVNQQTGLVAGDGGFHVSVGNNTQLNGAEIASTALAQDNTLSTGTFGYSNIQNTMSYSGSTEGIALSSSPTGSSQSLMGGPQMTQTGANSSGTTYAAVSPGTITVRSDQANGTDSTAGLSRDTTNANQTVQNTFNLQNVQNNLALSQAFGKTATYAVGQIADQLEANNPLFAEGGAGRDALHAAVAAIGAAISGGNIAGAVGGSLAGDALQTLAAPIINQAVSQLPADAQDAARNALNDIVSTAGGALGGALAGGGSQGVIAGAGSAANNEVYNRQLHPDERTWAMQHANDFAAYYASVTGQTISSTDAQNMLLANGYIRVDNAAASGLGYNAVAAQYLTANTGSLFSATPAEMANPQLGRNPDGTPTPEQLALPGSTAHPAIGLAIAGALAAPAILPALAAIPGAPILSSGGVLGSGAWASPVGIGVITGAVNASSQYIQSGTINPVDVGYAALAGGVGTAGGLLWNIAVNAGTGAADTYTNNKISGKSDGIATGSLVNAGAAIVGYGIGLTAQNLLPATNWFIPNNIPVIGAGAAGAAGAEMGTKAINDAKSQMGK